MPRKRLRDWPVVCRSYWVKPVNKELPKEVMDEAFNMNKLWNSFVAIGEESREVYEKALAGYSDVDALKARVEEAQTEVAKALSALKQARKDHRTKKGPSIDQYVEDYAKARDNKNKIYSLLKEAKAKAKEFKKEELSDASKAFFARIDEEWKKAYREYLYWANANAMKDSYINAWKRGLKTRNFPKFHRFTGEARFCHQFIGGRPTEQVFDHSTKIFSIKSYDTSVYDNQGLKQTQMKKLCRTIMTFQIGGIPVDFHINIHRPIPKGYLKSAVLTRRKVGTNIDWNVSFTIEAESAIKLFNNNSAVAAIDYGYRMLDGRMRIGVLVSSDKNKDIASLVGSKWKGVDGSGDVFFLDLWLPDKILKSHVHAKDVQSKRDKLFEDMKRKALTMLPSELPQELKGNWVKARQPRLIKIMSYCKDAGHFLADELAKWHKKDKMMYNETTGLTARALKQRKWFYYNLANCLCNAYGTVIVEKLKLDDMARKEGSNGKANKLPDAARENRTIAALSEAIQTLKHVAGKKGVSVKEDEPAGSTMMHYSCGTVNEPKDKAKLLWKCPTCGIMYDQDVNASVNLFYRTTRPTADYPRID